MLKKFLKLTNLILENLDVNLQFFNQQKSCKFLMRRIKWCFILVSSRTTISKNKILENFQKIIFLLLRAFTYIWVLEIMRNQPNLFRLRKTDSKVQCLTKSIEKRLWLKNPVTMCVKIKKNAMLFFHSVRRWPKRACTYWHSVTRARIRGSTIHVSTHTWIAREEEIALHAWFPPCAGCGRWI